MQYLFVFLEKGWWLVIENIQQLNDYYEKSTGKWCDAFESLVHSKEFFNGNEHATNLAYVIGNYGAKKSINAFDAIANFRSQIYLQQLELLQEGYKLYINENGGYYYNYDGNERHTQFLYKKELIFPNFKKEEIKIKSFPGGKHFYAYIGNMQVRNKDILKWNTYEEAMNEALKLINK